MTTLAVLPRIQPDPRPEPIVNRTGSIARRHCNDGRAGVSPAREAPVGRVADRPGSLPRSAASRHFEAVVAAEIHRLARHLRQP